MWIIIVGNPDAGFDYVGPFADRTTAETWAEMHDIEIEWWAKQLLTPIFPRSAHEQASTQHDRRH